MTPVAGAAQTLSIGSVRLDAPVVQAALAGYSDRAMRVIARRHGMSVSALVRDLVGGFLKYR